MTDENNETPRKGRSNAILTYEELAALHLAIQKVDLGIKRLDEKMDDRDGQHIDHEVRIRALELTVAGNNASSGTAKFLYGAIWPLAGVLIAALNFFTN